ncbi:enoyl-CoA hydratase/isomerase family protein [Sneathiella sp. CAU 1612]|uniref:Enoyl-CoA hydratase/isomerase family protein n=1 Tax=Sneathiella sedimenti TaxID=2816034 RepID=A0ABS3F0X1_9PROT|nr:enoyl-CoA hydratase-related protein [Sneathiella sedimenti]MBO0332012.1 enoyl-CoA hydratase/isomerase family protein [Sneathiella sedimenti]
MHELPECEFLKLEVAEGRLNLWFNRPDQRNAINSQMGAEFAAVVDWLEATPDVRVVVLRGVGGHFCAGGDIKERRNMAEDVVTKDSDPIMERNQAAGMAFLKFEHLPQTTIAVVEGSAFGGGMGYACLADITIVAEGARMGMPETTLGVAPAQIAPYVVKRIGLTRARQLALTGERFDGAKAYEYGIAQYLSADADIDAMLEDVVARVLRCGPMANAATKAIMLKVGSLPEEEMVRFSAAKFSELNRGGEGKEGQTAFAEKRKPSWQITDNNKKG